MFDSLAILDAFPITRCISEHPFLTDTTGSVSVMPLYKNVTTLSGATQNFATTTVPNASPVSNTSITMVISPTTSVLLFDVFGTCVDWRSTVVGELEAQAHAALASATVPSQVRLKASDMTTQHWNKFAQH